MKSLLVPFFFFLLCFCLVSTLHADDPETYRAEIDSMNDNVEKIDRLIEVSRELVNLYPEEAIQFAEEALELAKKLNQKVSITETRSNIGIVYMNQGKFTQARENLRIAINNKRRVLNESPAFYNASISDDYRLIGITLDQENKYMEAAGLFREGIKYAEKAGSDPDLAELYNKLGESLTKAQQYDQAVEAFDLAKKFVKSSGNSPLARTIDKNYKTSLALRENDLEKRRYMQEVEAFSMESDSFVSEIETIRDSLAGVQQDRQLIIGEKKLLEIERDKEKAAKEAIELEKEKLELQRNQYLLMGGGAGLILFLVIIGLVSRSTARRKHAEQLALEKDKREELIYNILPNKVAKELLEKKKVLPQRFEETTILFTDFKGFTAIASQLKPEELVAELETIFQQFDNIVDKYGLEKIKTIGDAYMAASGLPEPKTGADHAIDAVAAGLEMQEIMQKWAVHNRKQHKPVWELRVGINSGPVVAGVIGETKFAYDVWGDTVNLASRMESNGEAGKVNISSSTYALVNRYCECEHRGKLPVKNKGEVDMYFAHRMKAKRKTNDTPVQKKRNWWRS